jgi:hypothetical protein
MLHQKWPKIAFLPNLKKPPSFILGISTAFLVLAIPLAWSIKEAYDFSQNWLQTNRADPTLNSKVNLLKTPSTEWVNLPFGDHYWMLPAFENHLKVGDGIRTWFWKDREDPLPYEEITFQYLESGILTQEIDDIKVYQHPENEYATLQTDKGTTVCAAQAVGGKIDVSCPSAGAGKLIVHENNLTGWRAWEDDRSIHLDSENWLTVDTTAGRHTYHFRYQPWDVWVGILCPLLGVVLSITLWKRSKPIHSA